MRVICKGGNLNDKRYNFKFPKGDVLKRGEKITFFEKGIELVYILTNSKIGDMLVLRFFKGD